jgi:plasmid stabilization system protein ParE
MRTVRFSKTFLDQLTTLIGWGEDRFRQGVAAEKKAKVFDSIVHHLARFPGSKRRHPKLGLVLYPISDTPFIVVYDYDDQELRVHFVFIGSKSIDDIDPADIEW